MEIKQGLTVTRFVSRMPTQVATDYHNMMQIERKKPDSSQNVSHRMAFN
jgi:hypothetical protein